MVRLASRQHPRVTRWKLPRPFHRNLKAALQNAGVGIALESELRRVIHQILESPEAMGVPHDAVMSSLRIALVEAAMELGLPPGVDRNELLARMVAVCHDEVYAR